MSNVREILGRVAWQIPIGAAAAYGIFGNIYYGHLAATMGPEHAQVAEAFKNAGETAKTVAEISLAYALVLDTVARARAALERKRHDREDRAVEKATILRPPPADLGMMVKPNYFKEIGTEGSYEHATTILAETKIFYELGRADKDKLGISRSQNAFATSRHIILINPDKERDFVKASAARGTIIDQDSGKNLPLLKPMAIRMAVALNQYPNEETARETWDNVYHDLHGNRLLHEAMARVKDPGEPIGIVMDGAVGLKKRGGTVLPWGEYRYIGCQDIRGIELPEDAAYAAIAIEKAGIWDADKKKMIKMKPSEVKRLAKAIYENAQERYAQEQAERERANTQKATTNDDRQIGRWLASNNPAVTMAAIDESVDVALDRDQIERPGPPLTTEGIRPRTKARSHR